ncbi:tRNA (guanosine(37)-N1)-methyltransferase TrmD [Agromyces tropicus]|uniref:tRNA (guanine-N(1)-)-methyltransferase n=1 Tax=Agromyces tropicus TaxID=555371 RepID=A0ABP5FGZ7_9MICO
MRIDIVTIFPSFFDVLDLSLLGKARQSGLIEVVAHDLRDFTHDRHRTVDDTPYGGGAGMVMKPEPWGEALDAIVGDGDSDALLVVPSPAGEPFTQATARELAGEEHLVFACGRYEGIDQRVVDHYATRMRVRLISLGDYVLNGGEVAVMAMIEAAGRLVPGVVGNPESLVEESHEDGLLEYPSYTKPAVWRGLDVPPVLLSGHHGRVAEWRREQQVERTRRVRPELLGETPVDPAGRAPAEDGDGAGDATRPTPE